jgi:hypothetical protein
MKRGTDKNRAMMKMSWERGIEENGLDTIP